jgi:hypothetical protein
MLSESLNIHKGGTSGIPILFPPLKIYDKNGKPNYHMVAVNATITKQLVIDHIKKLCLYLQL